MASHSTVSQAVGLAHDNQQLRDQVARMKATVADQDREITRNRETIAAQALRIQELEKEVQEFRGHRTVDPKPVYVLLDEFTTAVLQSEAALALPDFDDDRR